MKTDSIQDKQLFIAEMQEQDEQWNQNRRDGETGSVKESGITPTTIKGKNGPRQRRKHIIIGDVGTEIGTDNKNNNNKNNSSNTIGGSAKCNIPAETNGQQQRRRRRRRRRPDRSWHFQLRHFIRNLLTNNIGKNGITGKKDGNRSHRGSSRTNSSGGNGNSERWMVRVIALFLLTLSGYGILLFFWRFLDIVHPWRNTIVSSSFVYPDTEFAEYDPSKPLASLGPVFGLASSHTRSLRKSLSLLNGQGTNNKMKNTVVSIMEPTWYDPPSIQVWKKYDDDDDDDDGKKEIYDPWSEAWYGDIESLDERSSSKRGQPRDILYDEEDFHDDHKNKNENNNNDDAFSGVDQDYLHYYAFDDDYQRGRRVAWNGVNPPKKEKDHTRTPSLCRRTAQHRLNFPTCNNVHSLDYASSGQTFSSRFTFLNHGAFRDVFAMQTSHGDANAHANDYDDNMSGEKVALKEIRYGQSDFDMELVEYVRVDALVAERLSAHPRSFDIYDYCGLTIVSELFHHGDIERQALPSSLSSSDDREFDDVLTADQKLVLALEMAQGLALLHGHPDGLIVHSDVQMGQFLLNKDKTMLKLNDYNRAEFMLWDDSRQTYCQHRNGAGHGNWRSPEEYRNDGLTDRIDVWSLGNNMYALLTCSEPILTDDPTKKNYAASLFIKAGKTGKIDDKYRTRSEPERILVETIQRCWAFAPEDRPDIFEIVATLEHAVKTLIEDSKGLKRQDVLRTLSD